MKKIILCSILVLFVFASTSVYAAEKYSLGGSNVALKVDYIYFVEDVFRADMKDGVYVGLEAYYGIMPNLYLGMESGYATASNKDKVRGEFDTIKVAVDTDFVPIELNMKYAMEAAPSFIVSLGAGVSYSWLKVRAKSSEFKVTEDDFIWGGQLFADLNYKMSDQWFIGLNGKYQFTTDMTVMRGDYKSSAKANNWRGGAQIGLMF
jgi:outer membrane protein W